MDSAGAAKGAPAAEIYRNAIKGMAGTWRFFVDGVSPLQ